MSSPWEIRVYEDEVLRYTAEIIGPTELGRQATSTEKLYSSVMSTIGQRIVITSEMTVSRQQAFIEPLENQDGRTSCCRVTNLSSNRPIGFPGGKNLEPGGRVTLFGETLLQLGNKVTVRLQVTDTIDEASYQGLPEATVPPGQQTIRTTDAFRQLSSASLASSEMRAAIPWLRAAMDVLQSAASSADFFDQAASAVVDLVKLDSGRVLLFEGGNWRPKAECFSARAETTRPVSRHVLDRVQQEKRTFWQIPVQSAVEHASLREIDAVVAAPILDRQGQVIGALYGDRRKGSAPGTWETITEVDAAFVELLARGVAAGLARLEQEQAALAARVQFEQFFTPELSQELAINPNLLKGQDTEVSLLICDIRGFSRICEHLDADLTVEWIRDAMGALSECVRAEEGVLVDQIGDELLAMWGAPRAQPDHARRACRAALAMVQQLPALNERWELQLKESLDVGIGVNTGRTRVGNTGSRHKFRYAPLGKTVNLASRVQGATKYFKCRLLITDATRAQLDDSFATRCLGQVRVVNIGEAVRLHQLVEPGAPDWPAAKQEYERALEEFENQNFSQAARILGNWRIEHSDDQAALMLLYRSVQFMVEPPTQFDSVWTLQGK